MTGSTPCPPAHSSPTTNSPPKPWRPIPNPCLDDARPFQAGEGAFNASTLPSWYMPAPMSGGRRLGGWRRATAFTFIAALVVIEAFGLCSTYGQFI